MSNDLLMIRTKDNRKLFTDRANLPSLIEYAKTFQAELIEVKASIVPLQLDQISKLLCDPNVSQQADELLVKQLYPQFILKEPKTRSLILEEASIVRKWIEEQFLSKKIVSLKNLRQQFSAMDLSDSTFCNHMKEVKKLLKIKGHIITKLNNGAYCIVNEIGSPKNEI